MLIVIIFASAIGLYAVIIGIVMNSVSGTWPGDAETAINTAGGWTSYRLDIKHRIAYDFNVKDKIASKNMHK